MILIEQIFSAHQIVFALLESGGVKLNGFTKKTQNRRQSKKLQIQDAQVPRNEAYLSCAAVTRNAA
jgi:hypothetical protein